MKILHCPTTTGGNPQGLAKAERELGLDSWSMAFCDSYMKYGPDKVLWKQGENPIICEFKRWKFFISAIRHYDVFHFNFGTSFMPVQIDTSAHPSRPSPYPDLIRNMFRLYASMFQMQDLPILKKLGKVIFVTYQGDDARQGDYCRQNFPVTFATEVDSGYYTDESDARKRHEITVFNRYADRIYSLNPDLMHVLPSRAEFLPYSHIDLREWKTILSDDDGRPLRVIHAPSHQKVKGTLHIIKVVERLKNEGFRFEFKVVEGLSHSDARKEYESCDILIDQLFAGWYGGLAVELMALGKPVMTYIRNDDLKFIPARMREEIPILNVDASNIYESLKTVLKYSRTDLAAIGARGRTFVENWHNPLQIAAKLKIEYEEFFQKSKVKGSEGLSKITDIR